MIGTRGKFLQPILTLVVFGCLWYLLIQRLSGHWAVDPQYSFGWFGPVICSYLLFVRWITRPQTGHAPSQGAEWVFWFACLALLPTWLVLQPNPDWRLISWFLAVEIVTLSLCAIYFVGGRPWLRHFAFSICFILTTLPWPHGAESFVTQNLMQGASWITVELLNLSGIAALQHGNIIEVKTGLLGVDEACSGVRSLQATVMVSLFLGELYRASWWRRVFFLLSGVVIAFLCNVGRTFFLSWIAAKNSIDSIPKWHDPAGFIILFICFFVLWGLVRLLSGTSPRLQPSKGSTPMPFPRRLAIGLGVWLLFTVVGVEVWYRIHEAGETLHWSFEAPASKAGFTNVSLPDQLGDERRGASWTEGDGSRWTAFFFKWAAGPAGSRILARLHRPENCLPAAGFKLQVDRGMITVKAKDLNIPFHAMDFDYDGKQVYVYFCLWQDHLKSGEQLRIRDHWDDRLVGLESVLLGERNLSQQSLEIVVFGYTNSQEADRAFRQQVPNLVRISSESRIVQGRVPFRAAVE
jgi:exosortase